MIYNVHMSVVGQINCVCGIMWVKRTHAQSQLYSGEIRPYYSFRLYARAALVWTEEKRSLRNEKLKANRALHRLKNRGKKG